MGDYGIDTVTLKTVLSNSPQIVEYKVNMVEQSNCICSHDIDEYHE